MVTYYFGCIHDAGHFLWAPDGTRPSPFNPRDKIGGKHLDTGFCPGVVDGRDPRNVPNGEAVLHHVEGWTILSFWDNSIDNRPGSHSTYVMSGELTFDEAVVQAKDSFPNIWQRYKFSVTKWCGK